MNKDQPKFLDDNEKSPFISVFNVARRLNISTESVRRRIKEKKLRAFRFGKLYFVLEDDLRDYMEKSSIV